MYSYEIFEIDGRFGYRILFGGSPIISQDYTPDVDGFIPMSEEEANYYANIILVRVRGD